MTTYRLGSRLREWRENAELTQPQAAEALKVAQQTVSQWETEGPPGWRRADDIDRVYKLEPGTFLAALRKHGKTGGEVIDDEDAKGVPERLKTLEDQMAEVLGFVRSWGNAPDGAGEG